MSKVREVFFRWSFCPQHYEYEFISRKISHRKVFLAWLIKIYTLLEMSRTFTVISPNFQLKRKENRNVEEWHSPSLNCLQICLPRCLHVALNVFSIKALTRHEVTNPCRTCTEGPTSYIVHISFGIMPPFLYECRSVMSGMPGMKAPAEENAIWIFGQ